jgi:hypothetical protein
MPQDVKAQRLKAVFVITLQRLQGVRDHELDFNKILRDLTLRLCRNN